MIVDVPSGDDFKLTGIDYLNLAWSTLVGLLTKLKETQDFYDSYNNEHFGEESEEIKTSLLTDEYWKKVQRHLSTTLSLIQQGTEFLLKGHIASVNPCLLISGDLNNHSNKSNNGKIRFSDFKTIDAQDLIKVYDTTSTECLPDAFKQKFEKLRSKRNRIMHSIDSDLNIEIKELFIEILEICHCLVSPGSWIEERKKFIQNEPQFMLLEDLSHDRSISELACEINLVVDLLKPTEVGKYFNFNKKQRRYICPVCYEKAFSEDFVHRGLSDRIPKLAQLKPNEPTSTSVYCIVCNESSPVVRKKCSVKGCEGNVIKIEEGYEIEEGYGRCLTCGS
jgi:hypothetical protein